MINDPIVIGVTSIGALLGLAWFALWAKTRKRSTNGYEEYIKDMEAVTTVYSNNPAVEIKPLTSRKRRTKNESK